MDSSTTLQKHLISLYDDYEKLLLFGYSHELLDDQYFKEHLEKLRRRHCSICNTTFCSSEAAQNHAKDKHPNLTEWTCTKCDKNFSAKRYLKDHQKRAHNKILRCEICNFKTDIHQIYRIHIKACRVTCDFCTQTFSNGDALLKHIKYKHEKVTCDQCGKVLSSMAKLLLHKRVIHKVANHMAIIFSCKVR